MTIKIITDSSCDVAPGVKELLNIDTVPLYINIGADSFLDGVDISPQEFYDNLTSYPTYPKTAVPSPGSFLERYQKAAEDGYTGVISIHVSEKLSGSVNSARVAAKDFSQIPIQVIDSNNLSAGAGLVVQKAAEAAKEDKSMKEILAILDDLLPRVYTFALIDTLDHLRHSGRMAQFITAISSVLKIRIMLKMGHGKPGAEQFGTHKKGVDRLKDLAQKLNPFTDFHFVHTNNPQAMNEFRDQVSAMLNPDLDPQILRVNPILGSHLGPTAFGFSCITVNPPELSFLERSFNLIRDTVDDIKLPNAHDALRGLMGKKDEEDHDK
jgi:DegV family protein with EDD domain